MNNILANNPFERIKIINRLMSIIDNHEKITMIMIDDKNYKEVFYLIRPVKFTYHDKKFHVVYIERDGTEVEVTYGELSNNRINVNGRTFYYGAFNNQIEAAYAYNDLIDEKKNNSGLFGIFIFNKVKKFQVD